MKNYFKVLLTGIAATAAGCMNSRSSDPIPTPVGTFSGQFRSVHLKSGGKGYDTLKSNITLTTTAGSKFKVAGDTSVLHAGSHGNFALNSLYINFADSTVSGANPAKIHLNGIYRYYYDGSVFQFLTSNDTLSYQYDLKRN